jgi:hypothetical protein
MTWVIIASTGFPVEAQAPLDPGQGPVTLTADHIEYDTQTGNVVADGHVVAVRGTDKITADHLTGNLKTGDVQATGHVTLTQPGRTATGEVLRYNYKTRIGDMAHAVATSRPWTVVGRTITTSASQSVALGASATPCDPAHPAFLITARRVVVVPDDHLTAYDAVLRVYGVPVFYVPSYTVSLKRGSTKGSRPTVGYDNFNGAWAEYTAYVPLGGGWDSQIRARLGTRSGLSGQAIVDRNFGDFSATANFGRAVTFDQNGNEFNLDQYLLNVSSRTFRFGSLPLALSADVNAGHFYENETGANAFRSEGVLTFTTDTVHLSPSLVASTGGDYRHDTYSTGQSRDIVEAAAALSQTLTPLSSVTLSYNFASVQGATPFAFDVISPANTVTLSYSYYPGSKIFQSGTISTSYDFLALQTAASLGLVFTLSPTLQFGTNVTYNLTTQQFTEIDYAVNAICDCTALGIVYETFPNAPASNRWLITVGITTIPGLRTTATLGGPP